MDITVIIPSRGRTVGLSAVLYSLRFLESGENNVSYGIACDVDDPETIELCKARQKIMPLAYKVGPRQTTMGQTINTMAELMPADVYCVINDDVLCLSHDWDVHIEKAVQKTPHGVFWWKSGGDCQVLFPIVTEKWRKAAGGIFSTLFPFWYDDLCLCELWTMTTDSDNIILDCVIIDKPRTVTTRMRELKFWQQVYTRSRALRVKQARDIAEKLGLPSPQGTEHVAALMTSHLKTVPDWWIEQIENNQGDKSPPDPAYLQAKENAQRVLDSL